LGTTESGGLYTKQEGVVCPWFQTCLRTPFLMLLIL
jgi:hypothetical protein